MPKKGLTKADVPAWCLAWQAALGLGDWDIEVSLVPHAEMMAKHGDACVMGDCTSNIEHKAAWISVVDPDTDMKPEGRMEHDIEHTLLHEHLHVCFEPLDRVFENMLGLLGGEARALMRHSYNDTQEQLINQLTKAFRRLKR